VSADSAFIKDSLLLNIANKSKIIFHKIAVIKDEFIVDIIPYCTMFGCVSSFRREISRIAVLGTPSESLHTHTHIPVLIMTSNIIIFNGLKILHVNARNCLMCSMQW